MTIQLISGNKEIRVLILNTEEEREEWMIAIEQSISPFLSQTWKTRMKKEGEGDVFPPNPII